MKDTQPTVHGSGIYRDILFHAACRSDMGKGPPETRSLDDNFGRLLQGRRPPRPCDPVRIKKLYAMVADAMCADADADDGVDAGFAFLGQFIDHDITHDATTELGRRAGNVATIDNARTPCLDLDSLYGDGPALSPFMYIGDPGAERFVIGSIVTGDDDLPRLDGTAVIGDPRNDENAIVSQLQLLMLKFHNKVIDAIGGGALEAHRGSHKVFERECDAATGDTRLVERDVPETDFQFAQRTVQWHYQWIVQHEFLPTVVDREVLDRVVAALEDGKLPRGWTARSLIMPVEFAVAAYRFGHSMISSELDVRQGETRRLFPEHDGDTNHLGGFDPLRPENVVDWTLFFGAGAQKGEKIDTRLAKDLCKLPHNVVPGADKPENNLAFRNLIRDRLTYELQHARFAADAFGVLDDKVGGKTVEALIQACIEDLRAKSAGADITIGTAPLWYYSLFEAEHNGGLLGPVGGTIVATVLLRILREDPRSFWSVKGWTPYLSQDGEFTMERLVEFTVGQA